MSKKIPNELEVMKMSLFLKVMADSTRVKILFSIKEKEKRESVQINKVRNVKEVTLDTTEIQWLIRD